MPSLQQNWQENINKLRFFGSQTKRGAQFPIIVRLLDEFTVQITSMPVIAGLMTIKSNGIIEGCNDIFVKYLFGFSQQELVLQKNISQLLPQFPTLLENLKRDDLLQQGLIINNVICRKLLPLPQQQQAMVNKRLLTHTPNNQPLPILVAIHRDGTPFEVQLQLKLVESSTTTSTTEEYALWISFDREIAFKRFGHNHLISQAPPEKEKISYSPTRTIRVIPPSENNKRSPSVISTSHDDMPQAPPQEQDEKEKEQLPQQQITKSTNTQEITYSAQTKSTCIDDYVILDSLGQGAYGLVKLAVKRNDPSQVDFPIWFIFFFFYFFFLFYIYIHAFRVLKKYLYRQRL